MTSNTIARTAGFAGLFLFACMGLARADSAKPAANELPAAIKGDSVIVLAHVDATKIDMKAVQQAANYILGDQAKMVADGVKYLEDHRDQFMKAGGKSMTFIVNSPDAKGRETDPCLLFQRTKKEGGEKFVDDYLKGKLMPEDGPVESYVREDGSVLLRPKKRTPLLTPGEKERQATFDKAIAATDGAPAWVVFAPNALLRQMISQQAERARQERHPLAGPTAGFAQQLAAAEYVVLWAKAGDKPSAHLQLAMKDEATAKSLVMQLRLIITTLQGMKQTLQQQAEDSGRTPPAEMAMMMAMADLLAKLDAKVEGGKLTLSLEGEGLQSAGRMLVPAFFAARQAANRARSAATMKQITIAVMLYANENGGRMPDSIDDLKKAGHLKHLPLHNSRTGADVGYVYTKPANKLSEIEKPSQTIILQELDKDGNVPADTLNGYADGHVAAK